MEDKTRSAGKCPVMHHAHSAGGAAASRRWWPEQLNLKGLQNNAPSASPMSRDFDYRAAVQSLDVAALKADLMALMWVP